MKMTRKVLTTLATLALVVTVAQATTFTPLTLSTEDNTTAAAAPISSDEDDKYKWEFWWGGGFDLASNYMWRGYDQSYSGNVFDPSFQPSLSIGYGKFYIELWGNASLLSDYKEFDMFFGFEHENLLVTIYDVFCGVGSDFGSQSFFDDQSHNLTATIDYTFFDRLRLHWATTFLHASDWLYNEDGSRDRRAFSSYFEIGYTQPIGDILDIEIIAGASPWTGPFWCAGPRVMMEDGSYALDWDNQPTGFNVTNLSLTLNREFSIGDVSLPVQLGYIFNPTSKRHYALLKAGFSF